MPGNKIPHLHKCFELIPASGQRHTHLITDRLGRIGDFIPLLVCYQIEIQADRITVFQPLVGFVKVSLFDKK